MQTNNGATLPIEEREGPVCIDIGCGVKKKPGTIGLDIRPLPGVDRVVDLTREPLPFEDSSVDSIFSSHCIEHLPDPIHVFKEMTRVARHGASLEIWVPYGWHDSAFLWDHHTVWNEEWFMHICQSQSWYWQPLLGARWRLRDVTFVVSRRTAVDLKLHGVDLAFALRHLTNVCSEMGVSIEIDKTSLPPKETDAIGPRPPSYYAFTRDTPRVLLTSETRGERLGRFRNRVRGLLGRG